MKRRPEHLADKAKPGQLTAMNTSSTALDIRAPRRRPRRPASPGGIFPIGMEALPGTRCHRHCRFFRDGGKGPTSTRHRTAFRYGWVPDGKDISVTDCKSIMLLSARSRANSTNSSSSPPTKHIPSPSKTSRPAMCLSKSSPPSRLRPARAECAKEFKSVDELRRLVSDALHVVQSPTAGTPTRLHRTPSFRNPKSLTTSPASITSTVVVKGTRADS